MIYHTGRRRIRVSTADRLVLMLLVALGIWTALYFAEFWFLEGHRKHLLLFIVLSYAVLRGMARSIFGWLIFLFSSTPKPPEAPQRFSADVMMPAMPGEPREMIRKTMEAIAALEYPHEAFLLDGGNDPQLKDFCERYGFHHVNCAGLPGAKAGKINHCLAHYAKGDVILVLDPDHIPEPDFLDRVVPHFADPDVGFVQVVQAYYNQDESFVARAAAEQTYGFYGPLMMGLNGLGLPVAIGANCTFRRKALDDIGGHAVSLAEDVNTSLRIHAAGYKSVYVPYRASYGLVPADLRSFYHQQIKWARGMFELFLGDYRRLFLKLNLRAKLYYGFAGTFYLQGLVNFLMIALPIFFLFFQVFAVEMPIDEFFIHLLPFVGVSLIVNTFVQRWYSDDGEKGFPWRSMFLEKGTWYIYFMAFLYTLVGKKVVYVPTPKDGVSEVPFSVVLPHLVAASLSMAAIAFASLTYYRIDAGTQLMMFFAGLNVITLLPVIWIGIRGRLGFAATINEPKLQSSFGDVLPKGAEGQRT